MESGFSDPRYFNHCFTRHYGCSPQSYRKNAVRR
ncbi:MAG: AraC family transcriptional regulator [Lentisphaeria bacterium]|nr:AraC family transcriptional regulator [Lentisphaeria bacterium]